MKIYSVDIKNINKFKAFIGWIFLLLSVFVFEFLWDCYLDFGVFELFICFFFKFQFYCCKLKINFPIFFFKKRFKRLNY